MNSKFAQVSWTCFYIFNHVIPSLYHHMHPFPYQASIHSYNITHIHFFSIISSHSCTWFRVFVTSIMRTIEVLFVEHFCVPLDQNALSHLSYGLRSPHPNQYLHFIHICHCSSLESFFLHFFDYFFKNYSCPL